MPVPIIPQNIDSLIRREREMQITSPVYDNFTVENLSALLTQRSNVSEIVKVSTHEAGLLFRLWKDSSSDSEDIKVPDTFTDDDIMRLKASGLLCGGVHEVKMTPRGKEVIKTMVLTETNALEKSSSSKTFEQRQSETRIKGGPRLSVNKKS